MAHKPGLGRGLSALLPDSDDSASSVSQNGAADKKIAEKRQSPESQGSVVQIAVDRLVANPGQPRKNFDVTELQELADSITEHGIIQPIIAADSGDGSYIIIAGERRTRAARLAGLTTVPAIIRKYTDQKRLEISLIENIQRTDLNPIEEAAAYKNLMDFSNLSQDELALRIGKNRSTVANALRLLKLPVEIQKSIEEGKVSSGHARAILSVTETKARDKLYRDILTGGLSVREAEKRSQAQNAGKGGKEKTAKGKSGSERPPEVDDMAEKFIGRLGTKVVIEGDLNKGRIYIEYYSMEDLERLYEIIGG